MQKARRAVKRPPSKAARAPRVRSEPKEGVRSGTKLERIVELLKRPGGCTRKQIMEVCHWPSVSVQQQADAAGIKLRVHKVAGVKYYSAA